MALPIDPSASPSGQQFGTVFASVVSTAKASLVAVFDKRHGAGAGILWSTDGLVLTNRHVLGRRHPKVLLADERQLDAEVIATDEEVDLALLRVDACDLPTARIGDSTQLRVGELVFSLGHPWGQRYQSPWQRANQRPPRADPHHPHRRASRAGQFRRPAAQCRGRSGRHQYYDRWRQPGYCYTQRGCCGFCGTSES